MCADPLAMQGIINIIFTLNESRFLVVASLSKTHEKRPAKKLYFGVFGGADGSTEPPNT